MAFIRLLLLLALFFSLARETSYSQLVADSSRLVIMQDSRIDELLMRHISINSRNEGMQGYRIRIFSQSGQVARTNATNVRARFYERYTEVESYLVYDAPDFKVYVGDFRTRSEALKFQRIISRDYPNSFIISGRINFPPLD